ncbi:MAG: hypothetical protein GC190_12510 [Alphaproteobacteria bacterium]|nr:hypothetical protein [Alphaproteobacteria bacterium]
MLGAVASIILSATFATVSAQAWCTRPLDAVDDSKSAVQVTLSGRVVERWAWGPPGFGEDPAHDRRWRATFLRLDRPTKIAVERFLGEEEKPPTLTLREIQLRGVIESDLTLHRHFLGRHVVVRGGLWRASIAADVGDVLVYVKSVRSSSRTICASQSP